MTLRNGFGPHTLRDYRPLMRNDPETVAVVLSAYAAGESIASIRRTTKAGAPAINRILRAHGFDRSPEAIRSHARQAMRAHRAKPEVRAIYETPKPNWRRAEWWNDLLVDDADRWLFDAHDIKCFVSRNGYRRIVGCERGRRNGVTLSRLIMCPGPGEVVDHINNNPLDNRRANLRVCLPRENNRNRQKQAGTSQYKGVTWLKANGKWAAQIAADKRKYHLGVFEDEAEAACAYDRAALRLHGAFARVNFNDDHPLNQAGAQVPYGSRAAGSDALLHSAANTTRGSDNHGA